MKVNERVISSTLRTRTGLSTSVDSVADDLAELLKGLDVCAFDHHIAPSGQRFLISVIIQTRGNGQQPKKK
jgi:hypothetical protein